MGARQVILNGLAVSVSISLLAIAAGSVLGVLAGLALTYGGRAARLALRTYIDIVRGTPVLVLVLASYYVSAAIGLDLGPSRPACWRWRCSARRTSARSCAARCRPFPGARPKPPGHRPELHQTFSSVLWPQALRQCLPAWVNTAAEMVKASTLLSVIGVAELLLRTQEIISRNFMSLQFYFWPEACTSS